MAKLHSQSCLIAAAAPRDVLSQSGARRTATLLLPAFLRTGQSDRRNGWQITFARIARHRQIQKMHYVMRWFRLLFQYWPLFHFCIDGRLAAMHPVKAFGPSRFSDTAAFHLSHRPSPLNPSFFLMYSANSYDALPFYLFTVAARLIPFGLIHIVHL